MAKLMRALCGNPFANMDGREPPIVDLEKIITDLVWEKLPPIPSVCCCSRPDRCKKKGLKLDIDWSAIERKDIVKSFILNPEFVTPLKPISLFKTRFRNFSGAEQVFNFRTERQTHSCVEMYVQQGLSISGHFNMSMRLIDPTPPVGTGEEDAVRLNSGMGASINWNVSVGEGMVKSETLTWGVDNQVILQDKERAEAELSIVEADTSGILEIDTVIKVISDTCLIPVDIIDKKTDEIVMTVDVSCKSLCKKMKRFSLLESESGEKNAFSFPTKMTCKTVYGVEQDASVRLLGDDEPDVKPIHPSAISSMIPQPACKPTAESDKTGHKDHCTQPILARA